MELTAEGIGIESLELVAWDSDLTREGAVDHKCFFIEGDDFSWDLVAIDERDEGRFGLSGRVISTIEDDLAEVLELKAYGLVDVGPIPKDAAF